MKKLIKIHSDDPFPDGGGVGRFTHNLALGLVELGLQTEVQIPPNSSMSDDLERVYTFTTTERAGLTPPTLFIKKLIKAVKWVAYRKDDAQTLLVSPASVYIFSAIQWFLQTEKISIVIHGSEINTFFHSNKSLYRIFRPLVKRLISKCRYIICVSQYTRERFLESLPTYESNHDKIRVCHNGIEKRFFIETIQLVSICETRKNWAEKLNRETVNNNLVILTVSRLDARKDHVSIINIIGKLKLDIIYIIAGKGPNQYAIEEAIIRHKLERQVLLCGYVSEQELINTYDSCDLFVLPSIEHKGFFEGFGLVIAEAAARSKPTLAYKHGGISEVIIDRSTGYLVDENDSDRIAKILVQLDQNRAQLKNLGQAARKYTQQNFGAEKMAKKFSEILDSDK